MKRNTSRRPNGQLRQSALITTFGPGAMTDLPNYSVLVSGLDFWFGPREEVSEPRLSRKIAQLLSAPAIRLEAPPAGDDSDDAPKSGVPVFRFPEWFVTQDAKKLTGDHTTGRTRYLVHLKRLSKNRFLDRDDGNNRLKVVPIRFVRACRRGHIGDIDWYYFLHGNDTTCRDQARLLFIDERGTSGDLSEIWIRCECKLERSMAQVAVPKAEVFGRCDGARPWLGPAMREHCDEMNRLLVRTASNAYFPQRMSVISLPERDETVREAVSAAWDFLESAEDEQDVARERKKAKVREALEGITDEEVWAEIQARRGALQGQEKTVKAAELETLLAADEVIGEDRPEGIFFARVLPADQWDRPWMKGIEKVVLVQRLREVVALLGFTRFEAAAPDIDGELDIGVRRAELARELTWIPAIENRGEGIFIQFRKSEIEKWMQRPSVNTRLQQLKRGFDAWKTEHRGSSRKFPSPGYILLHSFAHLLIASVALECGYPASSIRERIYALPEVGYGILLYTGSSDAEGTLGGLVEVGRRIADSIRSALDLGKLCSNDPVCSQHVPEAQHERRYLQGAACHGCLLIAETSCEQQNDLLDRALVIRTVEGAGSEFFGEQS